MAGTHQLEGPTNLQIAKEKALRQVAKQEGQQSASKYDFVKVKVLLGEDRNHYYVLSRFLISRSLTVTKIPHLKANKIALELKKYLVDNDLLEIPQAQLEEVLFQIMESKGFGNQHVRRYKMVSRFHLQRRPLIIFICGSACTGGDNVIAFLTGHQSPSIWQAASKSTLAQQLASRLNLANVVQTDIIYELLRMSEAASLNPLPLWQRADLTPDEVLEEYHRECAIVRRGIDADLLKCTKDGKSFIMEGLHLEPGRYLYEFGREGLSDQTPAPEQQPSQPPAAAAAGGAADARFAAHVPTASESGNPESSAAAVTADPAHCESAPASADRAGAAAAAVAAADDRPDGVTPMHGSQSAPHVAAASSQSPLRRESTRHRLKQRLRRLPLRSASHEEASSEAAPSGAMHSPPSPVRRAAFSGRVLFALRRGDLAAGPAEGGNGVGGPSMQPRLAPWPAAKVLLEALNPLRSSQYDCHQAVDIALASLHLSSASKGDSAARSSRPGVPRDGMPPAGTAASDLGPGAGAGADSRPSAEAAGSAVRSTPERTAAQPSGPQPESQPQTDCGGRSHQPSSGGPGPGGTHTAPGPQLAPKSVPADIGGPVRLAADATGAAATAAAAPPEAEPGPVFVPIVLTMHEADHEPLLEEWHMRQQVHGPDRCSAQEAFSRVKMLQDHFCSYQDRAVPVVHVSTTGLTSTLDVLHDYLLQCMELAMAAGP